MVKRIKAKRPRLLKRLLLIAAGLGAAAGLFLIVAIIRFNVRHAGEPYRWGATFSVKYSEELGLDPQETLTALTRDLGIRQFRFMSYWDDVEPENGRYDWSDLDWQMAEAQATGSKVSLSLGLRQPRWPECHQPKWVDDLSDTDRNRELTEFITAVVERYRTSPALDSYQLENEAFNTRFGFCKDFSRERLIAEFNLVKQLDPVHPVMISTSDQFGIPIGQPRADIVGFSVYHRVFDTTVSKRYIDYWWRPWWYWRLRASVIELLLNRPTAIHELQAEPWGPTATRDLSFDEQNKSMDAERLLGRAEYAKKSGVRYADYWGAEWWYWRKVKFDDPTLWDAARQIYSGK